MSYIKYSSGYKYQLREDYSLRVSIIGEKVDSDFIELSDNGLLSIRKGYAWDGPSGPTVATSACMRGSLIHDALYQCMRDYGLDRVKYKQVADTEFKKACSEDGMSWFRSCYFYYGVRIFGARSTETSGGYPVIIAPKI